MAENSAVQDSFASVAAPPIPSSPPLPPPPVYSQPMTIKTEIKNTPQGPVATETKTFKQSYSAAPSYQGAQTPFQATDLHGVPKKCYGCVQMMADASNDVNCAGYQVEISRTAPKVWDGVVIPLGYLDKWPITPFPDIRKQILDCFGGGDYRLVVMDENGKGLHQMNFSAETVLNPPKPPVQQMSSGINPWTGKPVSAVATAQMTGRNPYSALPGAQEDEGIVEIRKRERELKAKQDELKAKYELERTEKGFREEASRERELLERKAMAPMDAQQRQTDSMRLEMQAMQLASDRRMEMMMTGFKDMMLAMQPKKDDSSALVMVEAMKSSQATLVAMLSAMSGSKDRNSDEASKVQAIQAESNKQIMAMAIESTKGQSGKFDRLLETLITSKVNQSENSVDQAIKLMDMGHKRAQETYSMIQDLRDDGEGGLDSNAGFWSNAGVMLLQGLKQLVKGGAPKVMQMMAAMSGRPDGTTQFSETDFMKAAQAIQAQQQGLPAPQQPVLPVPRVIPSAAPMQMPRRQAPMGPVAVQQPVNRVSKYFESVYDEDEPVAVIEPEAPTEPFFDEGPLDEVSLTDPDERLRDSVNKAIEMAMIDIDSGVRDQEWGDMAFGKFSKEFLDALAQAPDDHQKLALIASKADPNLFQQLSNKLIDATRPQNYQNFMGTLNNLLADHAQEQGYAPATV